MTKLLSSVFRKGFITILSCPTCLQSLALKSLRKNNVFDGKLSCESCYINYIVQNSVPNLVNPNKLNKLDKIYSAQADGCFLPYKDNTFDIVTNTGSINTFGDKKRALVEMIRVTKPSGNILITDEGLSPRRAKTWLGHILIKFNSLYRCQPPTDLIPKNVTGRLSWVFKETFYPIEIIKPALNG